MPRVFRIAGHLSVLMLAAACTQPAAQVELRGQNSYARNSNSSGYSNAPSYGNRSYSNNAPSNYQPYQPAPVYTNTRPVSLQTEQSASTSSIGVSDLAPPAAEKPRSENNAPATNQWTGKPRPEEEAMRTQEPVSQPLSAVAETPPAPVAAASPAATAKAGYVWPVSSQKVISGFGPQGGGKANAGITIASPAGEPVWAVADGEVLYVGDELQGYGNMVLIRHGSGKTSSYAYLSRAAVDKYDRVKQGDIIGYVGNTGNAKKPQLYFAMRDGNTPIDPKKYLSTSVAGL